MTNSGKGVDTRNRIESRTKSNWRMKRSRKTSSAEERKHPKNTKNEKNKDQVIKHKKYNSPRQSPTPCQDIALPAGAEAKQG